MAAASFNIAPGESTDAANARRKIAMALMMQGTDTSPVRHWSQGAARALQSALGGYELYQEDQKDNKEKADARGMYSDFVKALYPQAGASSPAPAAPAAPSPSAPRGVPMVGGATEPLYSGGGANGWRVDTVNGQRIASIDAQGKDIPSPLDPPDGKDKQLLAALVQAEGTPGAANVVRNRAAETGLTIPQIIAQRGQFEPVGSGAINRYGPGTRGFDSASTAVDQAYTGNDPTRGAVNFYAPGAQAALAAEDGRPAVAKFDNGQGVDIGNTRFFGRAGPPVQSDAITAQSRIPPQGGHPQERAPAQAAPAAPQTPGMAPMLPGMLNNKYTSPIAQAIIQKQLEQQFSQNPYDFKVAGDTLYRVNPKTGAVERAGEASKGQFTKIGVDPKTGEDIMGFVDPGTGKVTPYQGQPSGPAPQSAVPSPANPAVPASGVLPSAPPAPPPGVDAKTWRKTLAEEGAKKAVSQPERDKQAKATANIVVDDIDRAISGVDNAVIPATGAIGKAASYVPGTAAHDVSKLVDTVKANAGFAELQKMRDNSPTGGALGNVSEREIAYLQATIGNLEQSQNEQQFKDNLRRVKNAYLDVIHGQGKGPDREKLSYKNPPSGNPKIDDLLKKYGG